MLHEVARTGNSKDNSNVNRNDNSDENRNDNSNDYAIDKSNDTRNVNSNDTSQDDIVVHVVRTDCVNLSLNNRRLFCFNEHARRPAAAAAAAEYS